MRSGQVAGLDLQALDPGSHVVWLYDSDQEMRSVLVGVAGQGLESGRKVLYVADAHVRQRLVDWLSATGQDLVQRLDSHQLALLDPYDVFLINGEFDPDYSLSFLQGMAEGSVQTGYAGLLVVGDMSWALSGFPGAERLAEYARRFSALLTQTPCIAVSQYDRRRFSPEVTLEVLDAHPYVMLGTELCSNPYYLASSTLADRVAAAPVLRQRLEAVVEHKRSLERTQHDAEFVNLILDTAPVLVMALDREGCILRFNRACELASGWEAAEATGHHFTELLAPDDVEAAKSVFECVLAGEPKVESTHHWRSSERRLKLIDWTYSALRDEEGELQWIVATGHDVTQEHLAQQQVGHLNSVLRATREVAKLIVREDEEGPLLEGACKALTEGRGYTSAWLLTCGENEELVEVRARGLGERMSRLQDMVRRQALPPCASGVLAQSGVLVWKAGEVGCGACELSGREPCPTHMTVRLEHEKRVYGLLSVTLPRGMHASNQEQCLLRELAADIGMALHTQHLARAEARAARAAELERERLAAALRLSTMQDTPMQQLVDFALEESVRLTGSEIGYIAFASEDESVLTMYSWSKSAMAQCAMADKPLVYPVAETGLWGEALRQRRPVITNDYEGESELKRGIPDGHVPLTRHMNVPVFDGERIVAVAGVGNKPEDYDEADVRQLTLLMNGLWQHLGRRRVSEDLRRSESLFRAVFDASQDMIMVLDVEGHVLYANTAVLKRIDRTAEEALGEDARTLLAGCPHFLRMWEERLAHVLASGEQLQNEDCRSLGTKLEYSESVMMPVRNAAGETFAVGVVYRDITARKEAERELRRFSNRLERRVEERTQELRRSNEELEQFAYVASHDLQEPLRMISSYVQLLEKRYRGQLDAEADEFIQFAVDGAQRMGELIQALLSYSRLDTRGEGFREVDSGYCLQQAVANLQSAIEECGATVSAGQLPSVSADEQQLGQVFQNLLSNALKFRGQDAPRIEVEAEELPQEWQFRVRDNGIGLDVAYADRIFVIFQRLHAQGEYPGTGIGLAVCKKIVERHGGRMWVESEPGTGSTFVFTIPKREEASDSASSGGGDGEHPAGGGQPR